MDGYPVRGALALDVVQYVVPPAPAAFYVCEGGTDIEQSLDNVQTALRKGYAVEGFRVNAVDYLLKPFGLQDFLRAANRLRERLAASSAPEAPQPADGDDSLFLKTDYRIVKVRIADIRYVEGMSEYLKVWVKDQRKPIVTLLSMKKMEERLPDSFMRIHRSYIVNLDIIREVSKNRIVLDADTELPVGEVYREAFQDYLKSRYLFP